MLSITTLTLAALALGQGSAQVNNQISTAQSINQKSSFVAPPAFPTSAFPTYYRSAPTQEPQPALYDPVLKETYPLNLTDPNNIPTEDPDPVYYPVPITPNLTNAEADELIKGIFSGISEIIEGNSVTGNCSKCVASLYLAKGAVLLAPSKVPDALVRLCQKYQLHSNTTCEEDFEASTFGAIWTQVLTFADVGGLDGQYICNSISPTFCPTPATSPLNTTGLFPKPKPANATAPKPSGNRVKVLHLSDLQTNVQSSSGEPVLPASYYGEFKCDTPYDLGLAALEAIGPLTGTNQENPLGWVIYTGDLVSHDSQNQLSRAYTEYAEDSVYTMFKEYLSGPVFAVLGNHDSNPEAIDSPHKLPGPLGQQQSWNYEHVAALWQHDGWIDAAAAQQARTHYAGYSIKNHFGLRIITFNTDFWYRSNFLNLINTTNPDNSGMFNFMIQELQAAEDAGEQVWILGHVLSGWDGSNPIPNPSDLFYQIVDRYSPHVIRNIFFGHTHEDIQLVYYANNGTTRNISKSALVSGWVGPSVTPLTNLNSGFRLYEVDTGNFDVYEAYTWYADVHSFHSFNNSAQGPTFKFEYSTRDAYAESSGWPADAPLNATFWHGVTEAMQTNRSLVELFNTYQGKSSVQSPNCTSDACAAAKVCYIRSGSVPLGRQCPQGFASVQSPYTGKG
ncbi:MAG: hypothetical protein M1820_003519 [Bogoriella megaspora]|nr:MAG: hypothetical protein M1820_003519 [Bogoriella megaspora]